MAAEEGVGHGEQVGDRAGHKDLLDAIEALEVSSSSSSGPRRTASRMSSSNSEPHISAHDRRKDSLLAKATIPPLAPPGVLTAKISGLSPTLNSPRIELMSSSVNSVNCE